MTDSERLSARPVVIAEGEEERAQIQLWAVLSETGLLPCAQSASLGVGLAAADEELEPAAVGADRRRSEEVRRLEVGQCMVLAAKSRPLHDLRYRNRPAATHSSRLNEISSGPGHFDTPDAHVA